MYVFVVIRALFSENTLMVNVMGVFAHMHQASRYVHEERLLEPRGVKSEWTIEKHSVSGVEPGWRLGPPEPAFPAPVGEGGQADPTAMASPVS